MKNSDKPAFPVDEETTDRLDEGVRIYTGLTKREYFAGLAMQGVLASKIPWELSLTSEELASEAISAADALLKQLEQ